MGLTGLILSPEAVLVKDGIKFPLGLGRDVMVEVFVPVGNIFAKVDLTGVDCTGEQAVAVVEDDVTLVVGLHNGEKEHVLHVSCHHNSPTLAGGSQGSKANLLITFRTDNSFCLLGVLEKARFGDVGVEGVPHEFPDQSYLAISIGCNVPDVSPTFSMALSFSPFTRERPLVPLIYHLIAFNH